MALIKLTVEDSRLDDMTLSAADRSELVMLMISEGVFLDMAAVAVTSIEISSPVLEAVAA